MFSSYFVGFHCENRYSRRLKFTYLSSVPMELTTVINPLTMKAAAKLSSPAVKIQVSNMLFLN